MMRVRIGKRIEDIFRLECVREIRKSELFGIIVKVMIDGEPIDAYEGEWICRHDDGRWSIEEPARPER